MLKGLAAWVLNTYLGKYLENLNTDQLSIALLQGEVELENIPLKKDALNSFELPLEIRAGFVQKIKVTIPLTRLRSEPWVISIEGLYIVAGPVQLQTEFNEETEELGKQFRKLAKLDAIEARWRAAHDAQQESSYYATSYSSWFSYGASVVSGIVENVQLNIYDVHIRYEDAQTNPCTPFAWGITINGLTAQSTGENWVAQFVGRSDTDTTRKLMELQDLAVYLDTEATMFGHLPFQQLCDALKHFQANLVSRTNQSGRSKFVIEPISSRARLQRNRNQNPLRSRSSPRFICDVTVDNFLVSLDEGQYQCMTLWMREFDKLEKSRGFMKGRPAVGVKEDVKSWWQYAIGQQVETVRARWRGRNWECAARRAKDNVLYVKAYTEHLKNPVTCPIILREHKDRVELELAFEELVSLREVAMDRMKLFKSGLDDEGKKKAQGILRSWFPLYRGWYSSVSSSTPAPEDIVAPKSDLVENADESRKGLEDEILDVLSDTVVNDTLLRRDTVFAQVNFTLKTGTFSLRNGKSHPAENFLPLFELGFVEMAICSEFRPRTASVMLKVSLGDMHLCDKVTAGSVFPQLIASHGTGTAFSAQRPEHYQVKHHRLAAPKHQYDTPLFEFIYESKPFDSTAAVRVHMKSRSLDIVYNPAALARFREFVSSPYRASAGGFRFTDAARSRYEELKRQTQDELKKNLEKIFDGEQAFVQQWEIHLQISAPQIIIPENLFDCNTAVVVCDFGHLQFSTVSSRVQTKLCDDIEGSDSEEDFKTPCSSPPDDDMPNCKLSFAKTGHFQPSLSSVQEISSPTNITEFTLHKRMYDSYMLDFSDLQIMVCKATDNWRHACLRGTSSLHVLDKFTISLQLNRRIVCTNDPLWPNATLLGNLPKLVVHVNEQKIQAVKTCLSNLGTSAVAKPQWTSRNQQSATDTAASRDDELLAEPAESNCKDAHDDSNLLVMQFNVEQMSLEIQSRGRSVAELQVKGIRVKFRKQPHDVSVTLTVHSLLLVDALQTFGPDFELLFASHKNVCIDTMSGSLRDSEPTSPASPTSSFVSVTSPTALNSALSNLQLQQLSSDSTLQLTSPLFLLDAHDSEALIVVEITMVDSGHSVDKKPPTCYAFVRFNNLDIIANQETLVELLGFLKRTELTGFRRTSNAAPLDQEIPDNSTDENLISELSTQSLVVTFEFHTLSILLMKSVKKDCDLIARKIATATMTGAKIQANFGSQIEISGSLGGLQVLDLSDLGTKYKKILCVGHDPLEDRHLSLTERLHAEVYGGTPEHATESGNACWEENRAFSFEVACPASSFDGENSRQDGDSLFVKLRVASVCYTYTKHFLSELASCASEFRQYAIKLANSIRSAAAEMAYEIVARKANFVGDLTHASEAVVKSKSQSRPWLAGFQLRLDIVLESPVLLVPESGVSGNVLECRLGRITIRNWRLQRGQEQFAETLDLENGTTLIKVDDDKSDRVQLEIRNINVHSLHWDSAAQSTFNYRPRQSRAASDKKFPVLHDTAVNVTVDWLVGEAVDREANEELQMPYYRNFWNVAMIEGHVINSLKVSLVKHQYRQIVSTLNYLMTSSKVSETVSENRQQSTDETETLFSSGSEKLDEACVGTKVTLVPEIRQSFAAKATLSLPEFRVELHPGIDEMQGDIVALVFQDFLFDLEKVHSHRTTVEVALKGVVMEDLRQEVGSKNRYLMKSSQHATRESLAQRTRFRSTSCPDIPHHQPILMSQQSLPEKLNMENVFRNFQRREQRMLYGNNYRGRSLEPDVGKYECPYTPPPSPMCNSPENEPPITDALVHVKAVLVDKVCPQFTSKYNSINRSVDVNFNALDMIINLQSWVMVLDFFDISNIDDSVPTSKEIGMNHSNDVIPQEAINTETYVKVRSLTLVFNKDCQEMAKANVSNFSARFTNRDGHFILAGKLGSMSLKDLTSYGQLYPERFLTVGKEALDFMYTKCEHVDVQRDHDALLKLTMSSVVYVHTNRFYMEMMAILQHFNYLQTALAMGREQSKAVGHVTRVLLDIQAGSPVILIPRSAFSCQMIVANLGNLTVKNRFLHSGCEGTLGVRKGIANEKVFTSGASCLLDVLSVELQEMGLFSAERLDLDKKPGNAQALDINFSGFVVMKRGEPLLKQKCELKLQIERNLHADFNHAVPDTAVNGEISAMHCSVDVEQYKLIRGILKHNLGEEVDVEIPTVLFIPVPDHPKDQSDTWTIMSFHVDLVNVTLELLVSHRPSAAGQEQSLAQINFFQSKLTFKRYSDLSKEVDLVSQEILMSDTRFKDCPANQRPNVFFHIMQPMANSQQGLLQAEVNFRSTPVFSRFTVVLNNMRVMAVFDWWSAFLTFIDANEDEAEKLANSNNEIGKLVRSVESNTGAPSKPFSAKYAVSLSSGVVTKRAPLLEEDKISYEFKINITETEVVVVENTATWDSNAVILKSTTVLAYRPMFVEKPLSCSLQSLEVFSCILGLEDDTALSIVDPLTINIDINGRPKPGHSGGLLDATSNGEITHVLEVSLHDLNIHVSYHDMMMFASILESVPKQANLVSYSQVAGSVKVEKLQGMGFEVEDCNKALKACQGNLDDAAIWLTQNATPTVSQPKGNIEVNSFDVKVLDVRVACICVCFIDDCKDADVPLAELTLSGLHLHQTMGYRVKGTASYVLGGDFYNRALSGWEPFLEPWRCRVTWDKVPLSSHQGNKLSITFKGEDVLNFNLSSTLLQLYSNVKENWTEDYYGLSNRQRSDPNETKSKSGSTYSGSVGLRKRTPFVPFVLMNSTGSKLHFMTTMSSPDKLLSFDNSGGQMGYYRQGNPNWISVSPGARVPFTFEGRGKHRHRGTHDVKVHQLIVAVDGWQEMAPVSVDKVGVFFRHAQPQVNRAASVYTEIPAARVVFAVTLEGQAQKLVTVRSALRIRNRLGEAVTLRMENSVFQLGVSTVIQVAPDSTVAVPLHFTSALLSVCPSSREQQLRFCNPDISWQHVTRQNETKENSFVCLPRSIASHYAGRESYNFCVRVTRENFPLDSVNTFTAMQQRSRGYQTAYGLGIQPGHVITLLPPVTIVNLLPHELFFMIPALNSSRTLVKPGNEAAIFSVNVASSPEIALFIEGFKLCSDLVIPSECGNFTSVLRFTDTRDRLLLINARICTRFGCSYRVTILAHYWFVNRSGLPLVFRQEGSAQEAAGQFPEHETARSVSPLLFSFAGGDLPELCSMRVGHSVHADGEPQWCSHFNLEKGIRFRRLKVLAPNFRPEWVYSIGIDVRVGRGQYRDTHIVTLSPRFYIENNSRHQIELTQKFLIDKGNMARNRLTAMSKSSLPFHWTRVDLEQLLCVRLVDVTGCHWSGGFFIEKIDSFHINMRDAQGKSCFLRVEVVLQGATYQVIFVDADQMPPPYRIDNLSEVPITFQQTDVSAERLRTVVRPGGKVPYAWDEPTLRPLIDCCAHGGIGSMYNMNQFGEGKKLSYENFIYVAFNSTFHSHPSSTSCKPGDYRCQELVLDVPTGTRVVLSKKEPSKRTQLWRMTTTGLLQHEGSSPPRDPKRATGLESDRILVLDIADIGSSPNMYVGLMLRKPDQRRSSTQTWKFTEDGRLCCQHNNLYVQPKDGLHGLRPGNDVVLGQSQMVCVVTTDSGIAVEQSICRQRLRPGSGILDVKVVPDGPTRVLQVSDIRAKTCAMVNLAPADWVIIDANPAANSSETRGDSSVGDVITDIQLVIHLPDGMGLSLVNHIPEELVYIFFKNITVDLVKTLTEETANGTVESFTVNNQLFDAELPVLVFVTPSLKTDSRHHLPAITFTAHRVPSSHTNVEIYKLLMVDVKNVTVQIEERLLWRLVQFFRGQQSETEFQERDHEFHMRNVHSVTLVQAKRYYFNNLKLILNQMRLSVITSGRLPPDLKDIKHKMGWTLVRFADAQVELDPFVRVHPFETAQFMLDGILEHYREELKSQAAKILGAVDFLGNPLGLMNDVTEGLSGLVNEGNVGGLVKNLTHGLSNSAAKVMGTLSDGLSVATMDDKHQEKRKKICSEHKGGSSDHIVAGLKGLGVGLLGGVTSIFTQTYEGASNEGFPGFISGFGKGLVGTVTKPAAGVLDFATGAASAVRDTSRSSIHEVPERPRPTRLCVGPDGLLPRFSWQQSRGQARLYALNGRDYTERFFGYEQLSSGSEGLFVLISDRRVYIIGHDTQSADSIVPPVELGELVCCRMDRESNRYDTKHYIELVKQASTSDVLPISLSVTKPKFVCDTESIAAKVEQQINYAKSFYDDRVHTLVLSNDIEDG